MRRVNAAAVVASLGVENVPPSWFTDPMSTAWGPRAAGPVPPGQGAGGKAPSGCLIALFVVTALVALWIILLGEGFRLVGLVMLLAAAAYFGVILSAGSRANAKAQRIQDSQRTDAERWRQGTPEHVVSVADDPLQVARELTAQRSGGVYLGVTPDLREWRTAERQQAVLVLGPPRSGKTGSLIIPSLLTAWGPGCRPQPRSTC